MGLAPEWKSRRSRDRSRWSVGAGLVALALAGCMPSRREVFAPVAADIQQRLGASAAWHDGAAAPVQGLDRPLDREAVVRIAIATHPRLQAHFESLGIAASAIAEVTAIPAIDIDASYKLGAGSAETEVDVIQDVGELVHGLRRRGAATAELAAAQARATGMAVTVAARAERAYYDVVAAEQIVALRVAAFEAADAAALLAERMHAAGNTTDLAVAREQDAREQARIDVDRARAEGQVRREALNAALGISDDHAAWSVTPRLPELLPTAPRLDDLETQAVAANLELAALQHDEVAAGVRVGAARLESWLPSVGVGVAATHHDEGWGVGPAVRLGVPLFDPGRGGRARARGERRRLRHEAAAVAGELRAAARATQHQAVSAYAEAVHLRDVVLPLRRRILDETLLHYNAMNATPFELLQARRAQVEAERQYVLALRRYWGAMTDVEALRRGGMIAIGAADDDDRGAAAAGDAHDR